MLLIRPAGPDDLPGALEMLGAAQRACVGVRENWENYVVLADRGSSEIHGLSGVELHGTAGVIRSVVVAPSARNHGYGRRLIEEVASSASLKGVRDLFLITCQAGQFYRQLSFQSLSRSQCPSEILRSPSFAFATTADPTVMYRATAGPTPISQTT